MGQLKGAHGAVYILCYFKHTTARKIWNSKKKTNFPNTAEVLLYKHCKAIHQFNEF